MTHEYLIEGMTCGACVASVRASLEGLDAVESVDVQLEEPQATVRMTRHIPVADLQNAIGHYRIREAQQTMHRQAPVTVADDLPAVNVTTYRPLILIIAFIAGTSLLAQFPFDPFSWMEWMRHFMAGFFLVFAFFKLLNLRGFAATYSMYDIIASRWMPWGYLYPFVELSLGIMYLTNIAPVWTNIITIVVLGISSIGVIQSNLNKRKIKCACLGDVFNLPMSTVTIVEDVSMVLMAAFGLLHGA